MTLKIGILQTGSAPAPLITNFGDYPLFFEDLLRTTQVNLSTQVFRVLDNELPTNPTDCDAWLITGSRHSVLDQLPWMCELAIFIGDVIAANIPLVGICFGHQIIAHSLGGTVGRAANGWSIGRQVYDFTSLQPDHRSISLNAFHEDQVLVPPAQARVLARSSACPFAILEYGSSALSIQAHPEFSNAFTKELISYRLRGKVSDHLFYTGLDSLAAEPDFAQAAKLIMNKLSKR